MIRVNKQRVQTSESDVAMLKFYHCNHSVRDIDKSCKFYRDNFGLEKYRDLTAYNDTLRLAFLKDSCTDFRLELTWYADHHQPYNQGDKEFHIAFYTDDYDNLLKKHKANGIVVKEDPDLRLYFVEDPDGYQIEVVEFPKD